jgi:hypothetical protein
MLDNNYFFIDFKQILHPNNFNRLIHCFSTLSRDEIKYSLIFLYTLNYALLQSSQCMSINHKYDRDLGSDMLGSIVKCMTSP